MVTTLKNTAKPVAGVPFPTVTICGSGLHMNNVEKQVKENFATWRKENNKVEKSKEAIEEDIREYMKTTFQISQTSAINILDILDTMAAPNADASVAANGVRENIFACQEKEPTVRDKREAKCD